MQTEEFDMLTIIIVDGNVTDVVGATKGQKIVVRDYDIPKGWDTYEVEDNTKIDVAGDRYQEYTVD